MPGIPSPQGFQFKTEGCPSPNSNPHNPLAYTQIVEMQYELRECVKSADTSPSDKARCVAAWDTLEERKRILRGRPLPGVLKPEVNKRKRNGVDRLLHDPVPSPDSSQA